MMIIQTIQVIIGVLFTVVPIVQTISCNSNGSCNGVDSGIGTIGIFMLSNVIALTIINQKIKK